MDLTNEYDNRICGHCGGTGEVANGIGRGRVKCRCGDGFIRPDDSVFGIAKGYKFPTKPFTIDKEGGTGGSDGGPGPEE
jgi:hypothetical protein